MHAAEILQPVKTHAAEILWPVKTHAAEIMRPVKTHQILLLLKYLNNANTLHLPEKMNNNIGNLTFSALRS